MTQLIGYADPFSVPQGGRVRFFISTDHPSFDARVVRLLHGDGNPSGPGFKEADIESSVSGRHRGCRQAIAIGSYVVVDSCEEALGRLDSLTIQAWIYPTMPSTGAQQGIVSVWDPGLRIGVLLFVSEDGELALLLGAKDNDAELTRSGLELRKNAWHFVAATYDREGGNVRLYQRGLTPWVQEAVVGERQLSKLSPGGWLPADSPPICFGAAAIQRVGDRARPDGLYNGKIERPTIFGRALSRREIERLAVDQVPLASDLGPLIGSWDFSLDQDSDVVRDRGPHRLDGRAINMPMRAATGHAWSGRHIDFRQAPEEYGAIHFHEDDLSDAAWEPSLEWEVPLDARSGVYAVRLESGDQEDHIPFVVRPRAGQADAPTAVLLPTLTYWAYANERSLGLDRLSEWRPRPKDWQSPPEPLDDHLRRHPEYGKSVYDKHTDGSGCCYSSRLRPIANLRPKYRTQVTNAARHLPGDLYLIDWLETKRFAYDVITDEDLHIEGSTLLDRYQVVITGSHPEYATEEMLDALECYLEGGGRLMYLGGNGYWWVTSLSGDQRQCVEVRRGYASSRTWESHPGECYHSSTGELGGNWRHRGRPANRLVGVGTSAYGHDGQSQGYERTVASFDPDMSFIFDGVPADETIGNFGLVMNGAAGDEIDRLDYRLGSPVTACVIATARGFSDSYQVVIEDLLQTTANSGGTQHPNVRADMVFAALGAGALFSVGSIGWSGSLSHNSYDNNVSRLTENVLRRFLTDLPTRRPRI